MRYYLCLAIVLSATAALAQGSSWEGSTQNWRNNPRNFTNSPNNFGSSNRVYGADGSLEGYVVPQPDGGLNVYSYPDDRRPAYGSQFGSDYSAYGSDGYLRHDRGW